MSRKDTSCLACGGSGRDRPGEPRGTCIVCSVSPPPALAEALAGLRSRASMTVGEALAMAAARAEGREDQPAAPAGEKRRKYGNEPCELDGIRFDSRKEAARWGELRLMERAGLVSGLVVHPPFDLDVNGTVVCRYVADFAYDEVASGERVVEDVKSAATRRNRVYRLKKKLMKACLGIGIREV